MKKKVFIPKEIKVGFQISPDAYTNKLGYVIYFDKKGVLRREKSFENFSNKLLKPEQYENEPLSGFVLNKRAGGYEPGWGHKQTYVRVYDPRGFEVEITVDNLIYILDNEGSIIGKNLEGEFVYAWSGNEFLLLPVNSFEYKNYK